MEFPQNIPTSPIGMSFSTRWNSFFLKCIPLPLETYLPLKNWTHVHLLHEAVLALCVRTYFYLLVYLDLWSRLTIPLFRQSLSGFKQSQGRCILCISYDEISIYIPGNHGSSLDCKVLESRVYICLISVISNSLISIRPCSLLLTRRNDNDLSQGWKLCSLRMFSDCLEMITNSLRNSKWQ